MKNKKPVEGFKKKDASLEVLEKQYEKLKEQYLSKYLGLQDSVRKYWYEKDYENLIIEKAIISRVVFDLKALVKAHPNNPVYSEFKLKFIALQKEVSSFGSRKKTISESNRGLRTKLHRAIKKHLPVSVKDRAITVPADEVEFKKLPEDIYKGVLKLQSLGYQLRTDFSLKIREL